MQDKLNCVNVIYANMQLNIGLNCVAFLHNNLSGILDRSGYVHITIGILFRKMISYSIFGPQIAAEL